MLEQKMLTWEYVEANYHYAVEFENEDGNRWWETGNHAECDAKIKQQQKYGVSLSDYDTATTYHQPEELKDLAEAWYQYNRKHHYTDLRVFFERQYIPMYKKAMDRLMEITQSCDLEEAKYQVECVLHNHGQVRGYIHAAATDLMEYLEKGD